MGLTAATALDAIAEALYAGEPAAFVAARDAASREARARGERELAAAIKALRRPTLGAWYVNVAARARLTSLMEWLGLGRQLRTAQRALDTGELRALGARRAPLEARVISDLTAHLAALGVAASPAGLDEVRSTLRAALADEDAAAAVSAARLDKPLTYGGFGEVDVSAALALMAAKAAESDAPGTADVYVDDDDRAAARRRAESGAVAHDAGERRLEERRAALAQRLEQARDAAGVAASALSDARDAEDEARQRVRRLEKELGTAHRTLERLGRATADASTAAEAASKELAEATRDAAEPD